MPINFDAVRANHPLLSVVARMGVDTAGLEGLSRVKTDCFLPGHPDGSRSSMALDFDSGQWACFEQSCPGHHGGKGSDVVQLVADAYGVKLTEAVRLLDRPGPLPSLDGVENVHARPAAQPASIKPATATSERPDLDRTPPDRVRKALAAAWRYYSLDKLHDRGVRYLAGRGIDVSDLEKATSQRVVGHTPRQGNPPTKLRDFLVGKGFTDDELVDAGLIRRYPDGHVIDAYRSRVILPVRDDDGRVVAFIGRDVSGWDGVMKYLNPSRTVLYDKSRTLYRPAVTPLNPSGQVVIVEGTLDALAITSRAASAGKLLEFAPITSSGLAYSESQLRYIAGLTSRPVVVALDGDDFGRKSGVKVAAGLLAIGKQSAITNWPEGHDPASYLAEHGDAGLLAVTRSGGAMAPPEEVRPRPSHVAVAMYLAEAAPRGKVASTVLAPANTLTGSAQSRYLAAAASVLVAYGIESAKQPSGVDPAVAARLLATTMKHAPAPSEAAWQYELVRQCARQGHAAVAAQLQVLAPPPAPAPAPTPEVGLTPALA
jgi:DNA primase